MTPPRPAAAKKAAAARVETNGGTQARSFQWRDLEIALPAQLPATIAFDVADLQANEDNALTPMFQLLEGLFGRDQLQKVRGQLAKDGETLDDLPEILVELVGAALEPFGVSLGESEASPAS